jgi:alpha-N-arabinofuranosidase
MAEWIEYMVSPTSSTIANQRRANGRDKPWKLDYFGVGNENWGCGGQMTAAHYTDLYRNFAEFIRVPKGTKTEKIAGGANSDDYSWTETVMAGAAKNMDQISVHYYTIPSGKWENKGSATQFDEQVWADTMFQALRMDELITKHTAIMDKYDPKKRVGLSVDEWGIWHDVEPGTNPGFLYQQNTMRDAVVAGATLNVFHKHADRVRLTAIAQMVNVLQAMILTDKDKMILTPTYWVYDLYKPFQGATSLPLEVNSPTYTVGKSSVPAVSASAAQGYRRRGAPGPGEPGSEQVGDRDDQAVGRDRQDRQGPGADGLDHERPQHLRRAQRGQAGGLHGGLDQGRRADRDPAEQVGGGAGSELGGGG